MNGMMRHGTGDDGIIEEEDEEDSAHQVDADGNPIAGEEGRKK